MTEQTLYTDIVSQAEIEARIVEAHRLRARTLAAGGRSILASLRALLTPFRARRTA